MTKSKKTKRALLSSALALVLCFVMLQGTTFAWFTDTASTKVNTIQAGNLDIGLYWTDSLSAEKTDGVDATEWKNAEDGEAIFDYDKWEPGYTDIKYIKIVNEGNLAFQWKMNIVPLGDVGILADVIDVYCFEKPKSAITRDAIDKANSVGTLSDVIEAEDIKVQGVLLPSGTTDSKYISGEIVVAVALKMQETAGNEYQGKSVGKNGFTIQLLAKQYTYEYDSIGNEYDKDAGYATCVSNITALREAIAKGEDVVLTSDIILNSGDDLTQYSGKNAMLVISEDTTIDLNGKEFSYTGPHDDAWYGIYVADGATLTIIDSSDDKSGEIYSGNAWAVIVATGTANIYGGNFKALMAPCAYKNAGYINIYDGTFESLNKDGGAGSGVLNVGDLLLAQYGPIMLYGGTFKNFEPGVTNGSESKVADGYKVESETQSNGDIWYTVVPN